ncbi:MAG TPA: hypothetical protein VLR46_02455 [Candidatus Dormibacteraeota bacterium]|nr:hypothetical protein [Candidatus Dormibacteraeota bacterium]
MSEHRRRGSRLDTWIGTAIAFLVLVLVSAGLIWYALSGPPS